MQALCVSRTRIRAVSSCSNPAAIGSQRSLEMHVREACARSALPAARDIQWRAALARQECWSEHGRLGAPRPACEAQKVLGLGTCSGSAQVLETKSAFCCSGSAQVLETKTAVHSGSAQTVHMRWTQAQLRPPQAKQDCCCRHRRCRAPSTGLRSASANTLEKSLARRTSTSTMEGVGPPDASSQRYSRNRLCP